MIFSLCICGENNSKDEEIKADANAEIEEEIKYDFKDAPEANFKTIYEACNNNIVAAKTRYIGKPYRFSGSVYDIDAEFVTIVPMRFSKYSSYGSWYLVRINMPEEEIVKFSKGEIVNVGGNISELGDTSLKMSDGVYIDDTISFEGTITNFYLDAAHQYHVMEIKNSNTNIKYCYTVEKVDTTKGLYNIEEAIIEGISFVEGDYIKGEATMKRQDSYVSTYDIIRIKSISKDN